MNIPEWVKERARARKEAHPNMEIWACYSRDGHWYVYANVSKVAKQNQCKAVLRGDGVVSEAGLL